MKNNLTREPIVAPENKSLAHQSSRWLDLWVVAGREGFAYQCSGCGTISMYNDKPCLVCKTLKKKGCTNCETLTVALRSAEEEILELRAKTGTPAVRNE